MKKCSTSEKICNKTMTKLVSNLLIGGGLVAEWFADG